MAEENDENENGSRKPASTSTDTISIDLKEEPTSGTASRSPFTSNDPSSVRGEGCAVFCDHCEAEVRPGTGGYCQECGEQVEEMSLSTTKENKSEEYPKNNLNQGLDREFRKLASSFFQDLKVKPDEEFEEKSFKFFNKQHKDYNSINEYFNNFVCPWNIALANGLFYKAEQIWEEAIRIALEWEKEWEEEKRLHKGTPYYFQGVSQILTDKVDQGLLSMHQALEEDKETHNNDLSDSESPALDLVLLNPDEDRQAFKVKVEEISDILKCYLEEYRSERNKELAFDEFKSKFLDCPKLRDEAFSMVHGLFKIDQIQRTESHLLDNYLAFYNQTNVLFRFCRVTEVLLKPKVIDELKSDGKKEEEINKDLHQYLTTLASNENMKICSNKLGAVDDEREKNFAGTLEDILEHNYELHPNSSYNKMESDIAATKFFRNFGAHYLGPSTDERQSEETPPKISNEHFEQSVQRILNILFLTVETYYTNSY